MFAVGRIFLCANDSRNGGVPDARAGDAKILEYPRSEVVRKPGIKKGVTREWKERASFLRGNQRGKSRTQIEGKKPLI